MLRALEHPSPEVRGRAVEGLAAAGASVVPALARRLGHKQAHVRRAAVQALGEIGPAAGPALTVLVRAAIDRDEGLRQLASKVLARVDPAWPIAPATRLALPAVVDGLRSGLPWVSRAAEALLARVGRPAVPTLVELLAEWEAEANRLTALRILGQFGPSAGDAAPALADILANDDTAFRQAAAETLARIGSAAAPVVPALIRALSDWSPPVRQHAALTLGAVGAPAAHAVPTLLGLLSDYDDGAREAAVTALAGIGEPAVPLVAQVLQEHDLRHAGDRAGFRDEVDRLWQRLEAEGSRGTPDQAWRRLTWAAREGLRERTDVVHQGAAAVLGRVGPAAAPAAPALVQALGGESQPVRLAAVRALGAIGPAARCAVPALTAALRDSRDGVGQAAALALAKVAPPSA
jgi:HEAT repeat protein